MSHGKCSFWRFGLSFLVNVLWKMLVLEVWIVIFRGCLMENACFGSLDCHFWWTSCGKCLFWKSGLSLLGEVSWKMLVFEVWIVIFRGCLMENARFGGLDCHFWWTSCGKCLFWKSELSFLGDVSWKMLVLEVWIVIFGERLVENACFGSLDCHF